MQSGPLSAFIKNSGGGVRLQGLTPSGQAFVTAGYFAANRKPLLVTCPDVADAERFAGDLAFFMGGGGNVIHLPQYELLPYEPLSPHPDVSAARTEALARLAAADGPFICVATLPALMQACTPPRLAAAGSFAITRDELVDLDALKEFLDQAGYSFFDPVEEAGTFAFRGGIIDIYPPGGDYPVRVELFDDEVESIRRFDPETQRSVERLDKAEIPAMKDAGYGGMDTDHLQQCLRTLEQRHGVELGDLKAKFDNRQFFPGMEHYLPFFFKDAATALDYLPEETLLVESEPERTAERLEMFYDQIGEGYQQALDRQEYYPLPEELYLEEEALQDYRDLHRELSLAEISSSEENDKCRTLVTAESVRYRGSFNRYIYDSRQQLLKGISPVVAVSSREAAGRMNELFKREEMGVRLIEGEELYRLTSDAFEGRPPEPSSMAAVGRLSAGFASPELGVAFTAEEEIFGRHHVTGKRKTAKKEAVFATDFSDVAPGDYVVHREHGIGVYHGTKEVAAGGAREEYLDIEYAEDQRLFLPLSAVYLLEKYSGAGGHKPQLDRMGGKTWKKTREKVKKGILKMARELLEIYAKRELGKGHTYNAESEFNREFAETFEYMETPGQLTAIDDVLKDMTKDKPMDRLVCGDVGYGKTEIAMRAAFAAATEGKQTAVLVPTTILADQHYKSFHTRMERFGVTVEGLSRFITAQKRKEILNGLEQGKVDVVIGTHRLLQKDVHFNDLGLIVIDEEQRFGVRHKEKLKKLRETVDVLTLSATPIPRTLHMSLSGIRDISIIATPPPNRLSIKTYIRQGDDKVIMEAVNRELARGGQVFFVHNRVESIHGMADRIKELVPRARLAVAHGQMSGEELEEIMERFVKHRIDVLVCTTIIESGLDIPNANTIIVDRADKLGLAQLYQLRGRVGRDKHRAYAYLLVPAAMTGVARKRIKAIEELSELGSGFKLASRDMEIRGAGNMLGPQQSGSITAVGFETYARMLKEAVEEIQSGRATLAVDTEMDIDFVGKLEESYIPVLEQRMNWYNRLQKAETRDELQAAAEEMGDRYGHPPAKARKLVDAMAIKLAGRKLGLEKIRLKKAELALTFHPSSECAVAVTAFAGRRFPGGVQPVGKSTLRINITPLMADDRVQGVIGFLWDTVAKVSEEDTAPMM